MSILLDTSVLILAERQGSTIRSALPAEAEVGLSVVSVAEYWKGVERAETATRRQRRVDFYDRALARLTQIDVDVPIALMSARLWADLERRGSILGAFDLLIAATALTLGWALATADVRDFRRVDDLELIELPGGG